MCEQLSNMSNCLMIALLDSINKCFHKKEEEQVIGHTRLMILCVCVCFCNLCGWQKGVPNPLSSLLCVCVYFGNLT